MLDGMAADGQVLIVLVPLAEDRLELFVAFLGLQSRSFKNSARSSATCAGPHRYLSVRPKTSDCEVASTSQLNSSGGSTKGGFRCSFVDSVVSDLSMSKKVRSGSLLPEGSADRRKTPVGGTADSSGSDGVASDGVGLNEGS